MCPASIGREKNFWSLFLSPKKSKRLHNKATNTQFKTITTTKTKLANTLLLSLSEIPRLWFWIKFTLRVGGFVCLFVCFVLFLFLFYLFIYLFLFLFERNRVGEKKSSSFLLWWVPIRRRLVQESLDQLILQLLEEIPRNPNVISSQKTWFLWIIYLFIIYYYYYYF